MPTYEQVMLPCLQTIADAKEHQTKQIYQAVASHFALSDEELNLTAPSGGKLFYKRIGWALTYLKKAGLISSPRFGHYQIAQRGMDVLKSKPDKITNKMLMKYPEFVKFWGPTAKSAAGNDVDDDPDAGLASNNTPQEMMDDCHWTIRKALADDLLQRIVSQPPGFFERLVLDLLVRMGYGGSRDDAAQVVGKAGDEGIDGIIKEDRLGLDVIYVQAKRWKSSVGSPEIQGFVGALQLKGANKGIFITTSSYTPSARALAAKAGNRVVLIDGMQLAQFMIDFNVGVSIETVYVVKKIDSDYFTEE